MKRGLLLFVLTFVIIAFVAPIPQSEAAKAYDEFSNVTKRRQLGKPKLGPFMAEETIEWDGKRMKLVISGNATGKEERIVVHYKQKLIVFDDRGDKISQNVTFGQTQFPKVDKSPPGFGSNEPVTNIVPASDWGTFVKYRWHSFTFVRYPGSSKQDVWYDHPDNYYTYHPEEWNTDWYKKISPYTIHHASRTIVHETETSASLWAWMLAMAEMLVGAYALIVASVTLAVAILGATLAFLVVYQGMLWAWVQWVWKAEQGDGWSYSYWGADGWIQMSHGKWRDIWYYAYNTAGSV